MRFIVSGRSVYELPTKIVIACVQPGLRLHFVTRSDVDHTMSYPTDDKPLDRMSTGPGIDRTTDCATVTTSTSVLLWVARSLQPPD